MSVMVDGVIKKECRHYEQREADCVGHHRAKHIYQEPGTRPRRVLLVIFNDIADEMLEDR